MKKLNQVETALQLKRYAEELLEKIGDYYFYQYSINETEQYYDLELTGETDFEPFIIKVMIESNVNYNECKNLSSINNQYYCLNIEDINIDFRLLRSRIQLMQDKCSTVNKNLLILLLEY